MDKYKTVIDQDGWAIVEVENGQHDFPIAVARTENHANRIVKALQLLDAKPATVQEYVKASDAYTNALNEWLHNGKE